METEIKINEFDACVDFNGIMLRQGGDLIYLSKSEAIQLRNF